MRSSNTIEGKVAGIAGAAALPAKPRDMHKHVTHNISYETRAQFADATLDFLRHQVPGRCNEFCDLATDNFRIISPRDFRLLG